MMLRKVAEVQIPRDKGARSFFFYRLEYLMVVTVPKLIDCRYPFLDRSAVHAKELLTSSAAHETPLR
jgi:hypothetical protein